jgi:transcriptional regulator GlxA family with amidase domain
MEITDLGRTRFHQAFRKETGTTFSTYLTRVRVARAADKLRQTSDPILDIAYATGFGSISRFYEAFDQAMKQSPKAYRHAHRTGPAVPG